MKLSAINEATTDQVERRIPIWIGKYFGGDSDQAKLLIPDIISADPTRGKYSEWLIRQWKNKTARFPEDNEKLTRNLIIFDKKKSKLQNKDINSYTPASLSKTLEETLGLTKSERKSARSGKLQLPPGAEVIIKDDVWTVVKITDPQASSILCSGTEWCVANIDTAEEYLEDGPLYLFYENGERKYLVHIESDQYMDVHDEDIGNLKFKLLDLLGPEVVDWKSDTSLAFEYASSVAEGRWPEGEPAIAKDPAKAAAYARDVIKGRWSEAEPVIIKDPITAIYYARDVIKGRWPEAELAIIKRPGIAHGYAKEVIKGRWPEAEPIIAKEGYTACQYARNIINGRWPEAEPVIAKDPQAAYLYAMYIIKGRWPEAESTIAKEKYTACQYAIDVVKGRWPEAEPAIKQNEYHWNEYIKMLKELDSQ